MPITNERYIPDRGRVNINSVDQSGSVLTLSASAPRRNTRILNTLGGRVTESQDRDKAGNYEVALTILDDRSLAEDQTGAMYVLYNAYISNTQLTSFAVAPAGSTSGMTEYTYSNVEVVQCPPHGALEAESDEEARTDVVITATGVSKAAIV